MALPPSTRLLVGHDYCKDGREPMWEATVVEHKAANIHVRDGISECEFVKLRIDRDKRLPLRRVPVLIASPGASVTGNVDQTERSCPGPDGSKAGFTLSRSMECNGTTVSEWIASTFLPSILAFRPAKTKTSDAAIATIAILACVKRSAAKSELFTMGLMGGKPIVEER